MKLGDDRGESGRLVPEMSETARQRRARFLRLAAEAEAIAFSLTDSEGEKTWADLGRMRFRRMIDGIVIIIAEATESADHKR